MLLKCQGSYSSIWQTVFQKHLCTAENYVGQNKNNYKLNISNKLKILENDSK